jgi:limonene-1,2-epoxide hydrolase
MRHMLTPSRRTFLSRAGITAVGITATVAGAHAAQLTDPEKRNVAVVNAFCASVSSRDMAQVLKFLTADCVYRQTETTPPATGHEAIRAQLGPALERATRVEWDVLDTYAKGPIVVNHRVDRFLGGARPFTWEGVGTFLMKDELIKEWFDYTIRIER